ncbi:MAG: hypothetical protein ABI411_12330 [Tahibacter sp.]
MRPVAAALLVVPLLLCAAPAQAVCSVDGGGPIVDGSVVTCTGLTTTPVNAPSAIGVTVTIVPGATIAVTGTRAIQLGDGAYVDAQVGSGLSSDVAVVIVGKNSIASLSGLVYTPGTFTTVSAGQDSVVAIYGELQGMFGSQSFSGGATYFIYPSATTGPSNFPHYVSNAGRIMGQMALDCPILTKSEFYNEPGGIVDGRVTYSSDLGFIGGVNCVLDSIVSNRGHIGKLATDNSSVVNPTFGVADVDFRNEATGVIDGDVVITRGYHVDKARGTNAGQIKGDVRLSHHDRSLGTWSAAWFGTPQRFTNSGAVRGVTLRSGDFIQSATASFAATGVLRVEGGSASPTDGHTGSHFLGKLQINGTQNAGCLTGVATPNSVVGGIVELSAGAQLGIDVAANQTCSFSGTLIGGGRFIKNGAGTQVLGADFIAAGSEWVRPPTAYAGGTAINAGTLVATLSDALGTGNVQIANNATLQLSGTATSPPNAIEVLGLSTINVATASATLVNAGGAGRLIKQGSGVLRAPGALSQVDGSEVRAGGLRIDAVHNGIVTVFNGATLGGSGTIVANLIAQAGATIAPAFDATSPVMLHSGGLSLGSGANLQLTAGTSGSDAVAIAGSVSLGGATLDLQLSGAIVPGTTLLLVDNDGSDAVQGTFAGLAPNALFVANGMLLQIHYAGGTGNDVTVGVINSDRIFASGFDQP